MRASPRPFIHGFALVVLLAIQVQSEGSGEVQSENNGEDYYNNQEGENYPQGDYNDNAYGKSRGLGQYNEYGGQLQRPRPRPSPIRSPGGYRGPSKLDILKNKIIENVKKANFSKEEGGGIANLPVMTKSSAVAKALGKFAILVTADMNRLKNAVLNLQRINQNLRQRMYKVETGHDFAQLYARQTKLSGRKRKLTNKLENKLAPKKVGRRILDVKGAKDGVVKQSRDPGRPTAVVGVGQTPRNGLHRTKVQVTSIVRT